MSDIAVCAYNVLEYSTIATMAAGVNPSYPVYRLYDRTLGKVFRTNLATGWAGITADRGASVSLDTMIIGAGHNLAGCTGYCQGSSDNVSWTNLVTPFTVAAGVNAIEFTPSSYRYWKFAVNLTATPTSGGLPMSMTELFFSIKATWEKPPARPGGAQEKLFDVEHTKTVGGYDRFWTKTPAITQYNWELVRISEAQKAQILSWYENYYTGSKPFFLKDYNGNWVFGYLSSPLDLVEVGYGRYNARFAFREVV